MPHPCGIDPNMEGCAELAAKHAAEQATTLPSLQEALVENAPVITERFNDALLKVGAWVESTESFAVEQAPFLVKEILWWGIADSAFWVVLGFILMSFLPVSLLIIRKSDELKEYKRKSLAALEERGSGSDFFAAMGGGIIFPILGFVIICCNIMSMLKPIIAPRLYLIEYFRDLVG